MTAICFVCNLPIMSHQVGLVWQGGNGWDEMVREQVCRRKVIVLLLFIICIFTYSWKSQRYVKDLEVDAIQLLKFQPTLLLVHHLQQVLNVVVVVP